MKFEIDKEALAKVANEAVVVRAKEMQAVLDEILSTQQGKDVSSVKEALSDRWRMTFDRTLTDPHLSAWAEQLAAGGRVIVQPQAVTL